MADILHRVGAGIPAARAFEALTTVSGLQGWWVSDARGSAGPGGTIDFGFCQMEVVEAVPERRVRWRCVAGPPEWVGTEVRFDLEWRDGQTFVLFRHAGWREPVEFMHHCSTKWATFLFGLMEMIERGSGRPVPYDFKIHVGD